MPRLMTVVYPMEIVITPKTTYTLTDEPSFNGLSIGKWVDAAPSVDGDEEIPGRPQSAPIWRFNECAENNPLILVGKESYYVSQDGFLMPVKKGQDPPDLRYFKPPGK